jgi:hypothetical protein
MSAKNRSCAAQYDKPQLTTKSPAHVEDVLCATERSHGTATTLLASCHHISQRMAVRVLHDHMLYPIHVQHVQALQPPRMTIAARCNVCNISPPSAADGRSLLHMKWDFEYSSPANKSTWKSIFLSRKPPNPTAVCNTCLDGNNWRPSPRFLWATASTIRGFLFAVYIATITSYRARYHWQRGRQWGYCMMGFCLFFSQCHAVFRQLLSRSIEMTKRTSCVVYAITRAHTCRLLLVGTSEEHPFHPTM